MRGTLFAAWSVAVVRNPGTCPGSSRAKKGALARHAPFPPDLPGPAGARTALHLHSKDATIMFNDDAITSLRQTDRRRLLALLVKLGDQDPEQRAQAALDATALLQRKGLDWSALVPTGSGKAVGGLAHDWKMQAIELANHAALTPTERAFALKVAGWKTPGADGLARMQAIAERVGIELR